MEQIGLNEPRFSQEDISLVTKILQSSYVAPNGPYCKKFESKIGDVTSTSYNIAVSSGTQAIHILLEALKRALGVTKNFDVLLPSLTFIGSAHAVVHAGGTPIPLDCSSHSFQLSADALLQGLSLYDRDKNGLLIHGTSGRVLLTVMPVNVMGWAAPLNEIEKICKDFGVPLIVDNAEGLGVKTNEGQSASGFGIGTILSFNGNKILTTGGGGMICTDSQQVHRLARHLVITAKTNALRYEHDDFGYNVGMSNILAGVGLTQLRSLSERIKCKKQIFHWYQEAFRNSDIKVYEDYQTTGEPNYWLTNIILPTHGCREKALKSLNSKGIHCRPLWTPLHKQKHLQAPQAPLFENTEYFWRHCLTLPSSDFLPKQTIEAIAANVVETVRNPSQRNQEIQ